MRDAKITGQEYDWIGPADETKHVVYKMQNREELWYQTADGLVLDEHSEFSVKIHHPALRSLSFVYRTLAVLPKSKLRAIHSLIGRYLNDNDS